MVCYTLEPKRKSQRRRRTHTVAAYTVVAQHTPKLRRETRGKKCQRNLVRNKILVILRRYTRLLLSTPLNYEEK